jgi:anti-sigma B factor antagonist
VVDEPNSDICVTSWVGQIAVVTVTGTLDMLTAPELADALDAALAQQPTAIVVDLLGVDFLASAGMAVLIKTHQTAGGSTALGVVAAGVATARPMRLVGIDQTISTFETLDEAINSTQS